MNENNCLELSAASIGLIVLPRDAALGAHGVIHNSSSTLAVQHAASPAHYHQLGDDMSPAFLTAIAVILCLLFRLLNVNSQALKPALWCMDTDFLESIYKIAPLLREP